MATILMTNHFASHPSAPYGYGHPQGPPSPPMDDTSKCSLPSISNLLGLADGGSPTSEHFPTSQQASPSCSNVARGNMLPPTPPMSSDASFDGYHSPPTRSVSQVSTAPSYFYEAAPSMGHAEPESFRQQMFPRLPVQTSAYSQPAFTSSYMATPAMQPYYPTMQTTPPPQAQAQAQAQVSGLYYQRPLPQAFPPMSVGIATPSSGANPWQHHHYISPSSAAFSPQSQDRYICHTCNKAFSRPSSLRIHSHSHTGEKPFKCPHAGCGKAFSVRSNMKRHERGCHSFEASCSGSRLMP